MESGSGSFDVLEIVVFFFFCLSIATMVNFWSCCHVEAGELRYSTRCTKENRDHLCPYQFIQLRLLLLGRKPFADPSPCAGVVVRTSPEITLVDLGLKQRGLLPPAKMADDTEVS